MLFEFTTTIAGFDAFSTDVLYDTLGLKELDITMTILTIVW